MLHKHLTILSSNLFSNLSWGRKEKASNFHRQTVYQKNGFPSLGITRPCLANFIPNDTKDTIFLIIPYLSRKQWTNESSSFLWPEYFSPWDPACLNWFYWNNVCSIFPFDSIIKPKMTWSQKWPWRNYVATFTNTWIKWGHEETIRKKLRLILWYIRKGGKTQLGFQDSVSTTYIKYSRLPSLWSISWPDLSLVAVTSF